MSDTATLTDCTEEEASPSSDGSQNGSSDADGSSSSDSDSSSSGGSEADSGSDDSASGQGSDDSGSGEDSDSDGGKNWLEWTITAAGAAVVLLVVGFLAYEWITAVDQPADLQIELGEATPSGAAVEIPVTVKNVGHKVAEAAVVEVCAGPEACSQLTFDYIPFDSEVTGRIELEAPVADRITSRTVSFRNP